MRFIDLFAGIGGFRKGLESAGHECIGFCEIDKYAQSSYRSMHLLTERERMAGKVRTNATGDVAEVQTEFTIDQRSRTTDIVLSGYGN